MNYRTPSHNTISPNDTALMQKNGEPKMAINAPRLDIKRPNFRIKVTTAYSTGRFLNSKL